MPTCKNSAKQLLSDLTEHFILNITSNIFVHNNLGLGKGHNVRYCDITQEVRIGMATMKGYGFFKNQFKNISINSLKIPFNLFLLCSLPCFSQVCPYLPTTAPPQIHVFFLKNN